jgi:hypothetical protein
MSTEPNWNEFTEKRSGKSNKMDADGKTWRGETEGESIFGEVKEFKEVTRKDGTKANVLELYNETFNEYITVWVRGMLLRKLQAANVESGKMIKIEFEGFKPLKSDPTRSYRSYKLFVAEGE